MVGSPDDRHEPSNRAAVDRRAFDRYYRERRQSVDDHLDEVLDEHERFADLRRLLRFALARGKRLRPVLTMTMADATGCPRDRALTQATIVELLHNATLVADDWADGDEVRRDLPAVWRVLHEVSDRAPDRVPELSDALPEAVDPRTLTVLTSHNLQAITLELVRDRDVQRAMGRSVRHVFEGFYLEARHRDGDAWTGGYDDYIETCRRKTGGFFGLSTWMPAITAEVDDDVEAAARSYGESFGVLYQVADDIADDDLPDVVEDPVAALEHWYRRVVGELAALPVDEGDVGDGRLRTAPAWACSKMFEQEGVDLEPAFLADSPATATSDLTD